MLKHIEGKHYHSPRRQGRQEGTLQPRSIWLYAELCRAAQKSRFDKELCLWYELRRLNYWGSGRLALSDVFNALVPEHYSRATLYRLLKSGNGIFWHLSENRESKLRLKGLRSICEYLNTGRLGHPILVRSDHWLQGRKVKRAWFYASFHRTRDDAKATPISRTSIQEATGVRRRQQIRYEKAVGVKRVANFAMRREGRELVPILWEVEGKSRMWRKQRRLGNIYRSAAITGHRGMTKRINRSLARSLIEDEARLPRRFFLNFKALGKCHERHEESFVRTPRREALVKGRVEWCLIQ